VAIVRLCKGCHDRSKPLNPATLSDYHPMCHPAKNKGLKPQLPAESNFFTKIKETTSEGALHFPKVLPATTVEPTHRGPKPMSTSVRDLLKGSAGMLEKRAKLLEKRAARIGAKVDKVWKKVEPLKKIQEDLLEAARKLRLILDTD
jgi:hypothetical protein